MSQSKQQFNLKVENLAIQFGGIRALNDVSFNLEQGQFIGLMGANGAGKTTLLNCISKVLKPTQGRVTFGDHVISDLSCDEIFKLGIMRTFQDLNFFSRVPHMLVLDYLKLGFFPGYHFSILSDGLQTLNSRKYELELKRRVRRVLEFFREMRQFFEISEEERGFPTLFGREEFPDLLDVEYGSIGNLSFAWRKRLDLARTLVSEPKLLLLDEPAQGLPPHEIQKLGLFLKHIQREFKVGALIVEHNVSTLMEISDKIVVLNNGEKIAEGTPQEININPTVNEVYLGSAAAKNKEKLATIEKETLTREGKPLLEVRNIDLFYGKAQALYSVSIEVYPGEVVGLIGTNGSGKSTILKAVGGTEAPAFGEIYFKGIELPLGSPEAASDYGIQYVPQGHIVFPNLTVYENLKIAGIMAEARGFTLENGLERVFHYFPQLKDYKQAVAASLSGGQQQMLAIGQALMEFPDLLLLDEPSLGLAPSYVDSLFSIIKQISADSGCAIILVEQNVTKALEVSNYIYMLSSGSLVGKGHAKQFINDQSVIKKNLGFS